MATDDRLRRMSLDEIEKMANEPGKHSLQTFGWRAVINELIRRLRRDRGSG